ncbi:protein of unknown function [Nitrospina watsonii]|uniref:Uncharacterized protein n=1 Tax=Nitrospina watsonii TaxID=1323948 RepID=A0ABN8W3T7_9BACT|nr:protein of unknown function [Nitrospina watsonii]
MKGTEDNRPGPYYFDEIDPILTTQPDRTKFKWKGFRLSWFIFVKKIAFYWPWSPAFSCGARHPRQLR